MMGLYGSSIEELYDNGCLVDELKLELYGKVAEWEPKMNFIDLQWRH